LEISEIAILSLFADRVFLQDWLQALVETSVQFLVQVYNALTAHAATIFFYVEVFLVLAVKN
jgi:hypothetical protein